jgi:Tfp pilus assembly protein FimV
MFPTAVTLSQFSSVTCTPMNQTNWFAAATLLVVGFTQSWANSVGLGAAIVFGALNEPEAAPAELIVVTQNWSSTRSRAI